jgi:hypothetical protein
LPPGTQGIPDTTIESTKYNAFTTDVEQDLNAPRPVESGGTGSDNARGAMIALGGEIANQHVDNYDTFPFIAGSFWSDNSATATPANGHYFSGICHTIASGDMFLEARDYDDPLFVHYVREKHNGVWGAWVRGDIAAVMKTGDTMTGNLNFNIASGSLGITSQNNAGALRWVMAVSDGSAESGANVGSNWFLARYNDNGSILDFPISVVRSDGNVHLNTTIIAGDLHIKHADPVLYLDVPSGSTTTAQIISTDNGIPRWGMFLGQGATRNLIVSSYSASGALLGSPFSIDNASGATFLSSPLTTSYPFDPTQGTIYFGNAATQISWDASKFIFGGPIGNVTFTGIVSVPNPTLANHAASKGYVDAGDTTSLNAANAASTNANNRVLKAGDTMTGKLLLSGSGTSPVFALYSGGGSGYCVRSDTTYLMDQGTDAVGTPTGSPLTYLSSSTFQLAMADAKKPGGGPWGDNSDVRIKSVLGDYTSGLDEILALHPKRYSYKGNDTRADDPPKNVPLIGSDGLAIGDDTRAVTLPYGNSPHYSAALDGTEFVGLIAQDAEPVMPEIVSRHAGMIDGQPVNDIRSIDPNALVYALINAVKILAARVEELEATRK